jgi:cytochrome P450
MFLSAMRESVVDSLLLVISVVVTGMSVLGMWRVLNSPEMHLSSILLGLVIVLTASRWLQSRLQMQQLHARARSLGCGPVAVYPHKDIFLGLDGFVKILKAISRHELLELYRERFDRYGNTYSTLALGQWLLMTSEHENIKTILVTNMDDWPIAGPRLTSVLPVLGPHSVFSSNGKQWQEARQMIRPSFVRDQVADLQCFDRHISNLIRRIPSDGSAFDLQDLLMPMTMDSSTDFMLGYSTNMLTNPSPEALRFIEDYEYVSRMSARWALLGPILRLLPISSLHDKTRALRAYVRFYLQKAVAENSMKEPERKYVFLNELLETGASQEYIIDQIMSIIIAGRDTTATAMTAVFWFLARHPDIVAKLRKEIEGMDKQDPTWEDLRNMKYLNQIIKECMSCQLYSLGGKRTNESCSQPFVYVHRYL